MGIDTLNIDSTKSGERLVHSLLLRAETLVVEHLTNRDARPGTGCTFTAVPPKIEGVAACRSEPSKLFERNCLSETFQSESHDG